MGLVHQKQAAESVLQCKELRQIGAVPIHAVKTLNHDKAVAMVRSLFLQERLKVVHLVVPELQRRGFGPCDSGYDAVVAKLIIEDEIASAHEVRDRRDVRQISAHQRET